MADTAFPAAGASTRPGEATPIRKSKTACQTGAWGKRQSSSLSGYGPLDVRQVPQDIFFRYSDRPGNVQRRHGLLTQQVDDLLTKRSHGRTQGESIST
jgi:hypothetical protein